MEKTEILVIGAGVVGLAAARELAGAGREVLVVDRNESFGKETSSRNSEVVHGGMYYPEGSLKARLCVEGRILLYDLCEKERIPCKKTGKLIVASESGEVCELERLFALGKENGVDGLRLLTGSEAEKLEPEISARAALLSPETGIVDSHGLMAFLESSAESKGASIVYEAEVRGIGKEPSGYAVLIENAGEAVNLQASCVINSGGLDADLVAAMAGIDVAKEKYRLHYCKGRYFRVSPKKSGLISRLVYPVPAPGSGGLGVHATLDLAGGLRLGPDDNYLPGRVKDYSLDTDGAVEFFEGARKFLPFIEERDLSPDFAGIRPKLSSPGEDFRDFIVKEESARGMPGFINLIGIESPGLTASIAIARMVAGLVP